MYDYNYFLEKKFTDWDPELYNWKEYSTSLIIYCTEYFEIWWNPNKFNWAWYTYLNIYCLKYKHIWYKDYLIHKLSK